MTKIDFALLDSVAKDYFDDERVLAMVKELRRTSALHKAAMQALGVLNSGPDVDPIFFDETLVALRAVLAEPIIKPEIKEDNSVPQAQQFLYSAWAR